MTSAPKCSRRSLARRRLNEDAALSLMPMLLPHRPPTGQNHDDDPVAGLVAGEELTASPGLLFGVPCPAKPAAGQECNQGPFWRRVVLEGDRVCDGIRIGGEIPLSRHDSEVEQGGFIDDGDA